MIQFMEGIIVNFRGGRHTKYNNHMILKVLDINTRKDAQKLIDKKTIWTTPSGKTINGMIVNLHGNKGAVRVIFERGMPGQAIGTKVNIE